RAEEGPDELVAGERRRLEVQPLLEHLAVDEDEDGEDERDPEAAPEDGRVVPAAMSGVCGGRVLGGMGAVLCAGFSPALLEWALRAVCRVCSLERWRILVPRLVVVVGWLVVRVPLRHDPSLRGGRPSDSSICSGCRINPSLSTSCRRYARQAAS